LRRPDTKAAASFLRARTIGLEPLFGLRRRAPHSVTFCMRGGAFVVWRETTGTRAKWESAATHAKAPNAQQGGAVQISGDQSK